MLSPVFDGYIQKQTPFAYFGSALDPQFDFFLHQHGISSSRAFRIHKAYGDEALSVLTTNPYRLAQDIHGIGFNIFMHNYSN
jgi:hypothetical protein